VSFDQDMRATWAASLAVAVEIRCVVSFTGFSENEILPNSSRRRSGSSRGYLDRLLRLTLLAPDLVEAIPEGLAPEGLGLPRVLEPRPVGWAEQRRGLERIARPRPSAID
jgi:hypothetical protein